MRVLVTSDGVLFLSQSFYQLLKILNIDPQCPSQLPAAFPVFTAMTGTFQIVQQLVISHKCLLFRTRFTEKGRKKEGAVLSLSEKRPLIWCEIVTWSSPVHVLAGLQALPDKIEKILQNRENIQYLASQHFNAKDVFFIGRNLDYAMSLEGSLVSI